MASSTQNHASLNEYKGNLFEYLVALEFSKKFNLEPSFITSLGPNLMSTLLLYGEKVRKLKPDLVLSLPLLAKQTVRDCLQILTLPQIDRIELQGKIQAKGGNEGDICLSHNQGQYFISLKLAKANSFIHTKNAGIKTFFLEYFPLFDCGWIQENLNSFLHDSFLQMGEELYYENQMNFQGEWDEQWTDQGLSELPGELPLHLKKIVHNHHRRVLIKVYEHIRNLYKQHKENFKKCLYPLLGFTEKITQVQVFHKSHEFQSTTILNEKTLPQLTHFIHWPSKKIDTTSFFLDFSAHRFQLRVKPVNKFNIESLKVDCAIKQLT